MNFDRNATHIVASMAFGCGLVEIAAVWAIHDTHDHVAWLGIFIAVVALAMAGYLWRKLWKTRSK